MPDKRRNESRKIEDFQREIYSISLLLTKREKNRNNKNTWCYPLTFIKYGKLKKNQVKFLFFLKLFYFVLKYVFISVNKVIL